MLCAGDEAVTRDPCGDARQAGLTPLASTVPILVVDDAPYFCAAVTRALAAGPLQPFAVGTATDGLRFVARTAPFDGAPRPAFVVLDFNLPDAKAPAVLTDLRAAPHAVALPVVVLSQIADTADERAVLSAGAQAYH